MWLLYFSFGLLVGIIVGLLFGISVLFDDIHGRIKEAIEYLRRGPPD